jgi:23S rRNA (guanine1835-N2)-methyltransferase
MINKITTINEIAIKKINPNLKRYPHLKKDPLQAWDSADELILNYLSESSLLDFFKDKKILIIQDQFGALGCALEDFNITTYTDSYVSFKGIQFNSESRITPISELNELTGTYDFVLMRIPKNMSFLEDILCHLTHHLHGSSKVICGYMIKHQAKTSFDLINKYIGTTSTSLAKKKARLILADFQRSKVQSPYPLQIQVESSPFQFSLVNHSNLFSREKLDIGTRFLLSHIPQDNSRVILDLGCANGIIGIAAKRLNPDAKIIFADESKMAVQSAQINYNPLFQDSSQAEFHWTHCCEDQTSGSVDLVICNPPFHQGNTVGDFIAYQMFKDAHRVLVNQGKIRIIGNLNLQYQIMLKKIFGNSEIVAKNNKFMIVDAFR